MWKEAARGICTRNSPLFPLESDGKKASSRGLEVKFLETRQEAQPSSANGGWIWDMSRVKQHLQKSTVVQMQSKWVVTAGSPGWRWLRCSSVGRFHCKICRLGFSSPGDMWCLCWPWLCFPTARAVICTCAKWKEKTTVVVQQHFTSSPVRMHKAFYNFTHPNPKWDWRLGRSRAPIICTGI